METTGKPKATPQSARCPTTAGGRTPFSPVYNTTVPAVVAKAQLRTPWRRIVPPAETPAQPTATPKPHSFFEAAARTPHIKPEDDLASYSPARLF